MIIYDIFFSLGKLYSESDILKSLVKNNQLYNLDYLFKYPLYYPD